MTTVRDVGACPCVPKPHIFPTLRVPTSSSQYLRMTSSALSVISGASSTTLVKILPGNRRHQGGAVTGGGRHWDEGHRWATPRTIWRDVCGPRAAALAVLALWSLVKRLVAPSRPWRHHSYPSFWSGFSWRPARSPMRHSS